MSDVLTDVEAARRQAWADRPSPALPLLLLAAVVLGGIGVAFIETDQHGMYLDDPVRLAYWSIATLVAYVVMILVARHQGYRTGIWVDRRALVIAGLPALMIVVVLVVVSSRTPFLPGDLTLRGNLPLLAIAVGVIVWAYRERRPGLWVLAAVLVPLTLLANLYDMENLLFRLGVPYFAYAAEVVNLAVVAAVLLVAAGVFNLSRRRSVRQVRAER